MEDATAMKMQTLPSEGENATKLLDVSDQPEKTRPWVFLVIGTEVSSTEEMCITGDCDSLGNWRHDSIFRMMRHNETSGKQNGWKGVVNIPADRDVRFRYCICSYFIDEDDGNRTKMMISRIENGPSARIIKVNESNERLKDGTFDIFGDADDKNIVIDDGPLTDESVFQLIVTKHSSMRDLLCFKDKEIFVEVKPQMLASSTKPNAEKCPYSVSAENSSDTGEVDASDEDDFDPLKQLKITEKFRPVTLVSDYSSKDSRFKKQEKYGHILEDGQHLAFAVRTFAAERMLYTLNFYVPSANDKKELVAFATVIPRSKSSSGDLDVPITVFKGFRRSIIKVKYLVVHPTIGMKHDLSVSYSKFWKDSWKGLEVGHRGTGVSFSDQLKHNADIRENTIGSLKYAAEHGADMVEFDVQLSKDLIPAIYHDFYVLINVQNNNKETSTKLKMPLQDFSSSELRSLMIHHVKEKNVVKSFLNDTQEDHQPFPSLQQAFNEIHPYLGFNVEIKYTQDNEDGVPELDYPLDMNKYVDTILKVVFLNAGTRYVVFSSFNPDICTMLKFKQSTYPVLFLTQAITQKYRKYQDFRTGNIPMAIQFARSINILGINVHSENLLRDPGCIKDVLDAGLVLFCWGDDNNDEKNIEFLKSKGVHGIIFDKFDLFTRKKDRESIFEKEQFKIKNSVMFTNPDVDPNAAQSKGGFSLVLGNTSSLRVTPGTKSSTII